MGATEFVANQTPLLLLAEIGSISWLKWILIQVVQTQQVQGLVRFHV